MKDLPAVMADVAGSLKEADEYERLQGQRQRGVYNLLTGLPGLLFLAWIGPDVDWFGPLGDVAVSFALFGLFVLSCSLPKILLPVVRRRRPDWESAFLQAPLVNKALEKQFWAQAGFAFIGFMLLPQRQKVVLVTPAGDAMFRAYVTQVRAVLDGLSASMPADPIDRQSSAM